MAELKSKSLPAVKLLPTDYQLLTEPSSVDDYIRLRHESELTARTRDQAGPALRGSLYHVTIRHTPTDTIVGMGRVFGDGGWYYHIADMAVLPAHQRKGLGAIILHKLLSQILHDAPRGQPFVSLMADPAGQKLYEQFGLEALPGVIGMSRRRW